MINKLIELFSFEFVVYAFIVGILIAVCTALLGVELVLKKYSMLGDGLSHVSFGTLAVAMVFNFAPLEFALICVLIVAFLLLRISRNSKINGDAAIAMVSGSFLALGIFISRVSGGFNQNLNDYMFGSIYAIKDSDLPLCIIMTAAVIIVYVLFYNKIFAVTFDEDFAKATGAKVELYNLILALLTAITVVIGMKLIGTLLISSLTVFPVVSALKLAKRYKTAVCCSVGISLFAFIFGFVLSCLYDNMPLSTAVIFINLIVYLVITLFTAIKKRKRI